MNGDDGVDDATTGLARHGTSSVVAVMAITLNIMLTPMVIGVWTRHGIWANAKVPRPYASG